MSKPTPMPTVVTIEIYDKANGSVGIRGEFDPVYTKAGPNSPAAEFAYKLLQELAANSYSGGAEDGNGKSVSWGEPTDGPSGSN